MGRHLINHLNFLRNRHLCLRGGIEEKNYQSYKKMFCFAQLNIHKAANFLTLINFYQLAPDDVIVACIQNTSKSNWTMTKEAVPPPGKKLNIHKQFLES